MAQGKRIEFRVAENQGKSRLDKILAEMIPSSSRSFLQKLIRDHRVSVDGAPCDVPRRLLMIGEKIQVLLPEEADTTPSAENFAFPILFEDEVMLVINKPAGVVVHPGAGTHEGTVVNALLGRYPDMATRFDCSDSRPGIVHRLDKETSGVLVIAKTPEAQFKLSRSFAERETSKTYLAVLCGIPAKASQEITTLIGRHPVNRKKMAVVERNGKTAISRYRLLGSGEIDGRNFSLVEVAIATGRTHQIRVHMAHLGFPVLGDALYGGNKTHFDGVDRQMLHAWKLAIPHPLTGEEMKFTAPIPEDMAKTVKKIAGEKADYFC